MDPTQYHALLSPSRVLTVTASSIIICKLYKGSTRSCYQNDLVTKAYKSITFIVSIDLALLIRPM